MNKLEQLKAEYDEAIAAYSTAEQAALKCKRAREVARQAVVSEEAKQRRDDKVWHSLSWNEKERLDPKRFQAEWDAKIASHLASRDESID